MLHLVQQAQLARLAMILSMTLYWWCGVYLLILYSQVVPQVLEESRKRNMHVHISLSQMAVNGRR